MRKINSIYSLVKMRRNVKFILVFSISWMFVLLYFLQGSGKVTKPISGVKPAGFNLSL